MRVFVAGGTGAIGRRLVPQLVAAGHEVAATTRFAEKAALVESLGARAVVLDALDPGAVGRAVREFGTQAVMHQLTDLPQRYNPRRLGPWYERTSRLRVDGTGHLLAAARAAGARRFIYQSIAFMYAAAGPRVVDEGAPLAVNEPEPLGATIRATAEGERLAMTTDGITGVVLRYGQLYGPGTYFDASGHFIREARRRRLPIVGAGEGMFSFVHVDDAARAAVCALEQGSGVYNIVDDEPAPTREWIPAFCAEVGAPPPMRVPAWLAAIFVGRAVAGTLQTARGVSNAKAKRELAWTPAHATWRDGFLEGGDRP
jgi:nucleoside-diphosphate-sugar epimerase